ncbi:MAG TPA: DNA polymerase Y family protein [Methylocystis sp.]|nr:DNA polymerase Y family protein [Methylocystis sp.]
MRFVSVFLSRLSTDRLLRQSAAPGRDAPFALWRKVKGGERLVAVNAAAERRGLKRGLAVADARALCPVLRLEEQDLIAEAATLGSIADWHRRFTPLAAADPPDGVLLDVTGAAPLFGGEAKLLEEIEGRLAAQGFAARAALAPGPALARALARFSAVRLVPPDAGQEQIEALAAKLPVAALALDEPQAGRLARAGLRLIGDLLSRPRAPLAARLGPEAMARLDALACRRREPIAPRFEAPDYIVERRFPDGLTRTADIEATLARLAADLKALLERQNVGARRLEAEFFRVDGVARRIVVETSRPLRDPARIFALLRERLERLGEEGLDTGYGFDVLRLCAARVERLEAGQGDFMGESPGAGDDDLADLIDRLGARLGPARVQRLYPCARRWPERAVVVRPASYPRPEEAAGEKFPPFARPPRLLERAEPIEAEALLPQGPPRRFRWRRLWRETAAYEGPERIAPPWWGNLQDASERDYFIVVDREGARLWLYRENRSDAEDPRWFVQGLF